MTVTEHECPYRLDLVTLLVQDLQKTCAYYEQYLGLIEEESGTLPDSLALRLGYPVLKGALYAGLRGTTGARLRLIATADASRLRPTKGWHTVCVKSAHASPESTQSRDVQLDPDNHPLRIPGGANRAICLRSITLETKQAADHAAFYQGLIGARVTDRPNASKLLGLSGSNGIEIGPAAQPPTCARPLSVRLYRPKVGNETIPQLTALARCLRGPQDEIIELI